LSISSSAQQKLILDSIFSPSIDAHKKFYILVPEKAKGPLPVLYLLHGAWGDYKNWTENTNLQKIAKDMPLIIVMPDAGNSFYVNSIANPKLRYADYILQDLSKYVEKKYSVDTSRQGIAGLSMGGYGAFYLSSLHPERFLLSASLSGAIAIPGRNYEPIDTSEITPITNILLEVFGQPDATTYKKLYPPDFAQNLNPETVPYYYFAHGVQDQFENFLPVHRELVEVLRAKDIAYEYHELQGEHDWKFWGKHIPEVLELFMNLCQEKSAE
jgi:putative tributyrin esterase